MEAEALTVRVDATAIELTPTPTTPQVFYRPDALAATQPTVSKHLTNKLHASQTHRITKGQ